MSGKAARVELTELMQLKLQHMVSSRSLGSAVVTRSKIILMAFDKHCNPVIGEQLKCSRETGGLWRRRWRDSYTVLLSLQFAVPEAAFRRAMIECRSNAPRCGSPGTFRPEQIVGVIAIACEPPERSGRPVST